MSLFALVDCNNFYASCERAFNPSLNNKPIVVLSNNDGCIIARSEEAKQLGIPMGAPYFKWKSLCIAHKVHVFSSNYELYGDMSRRVMTLLKQMCPDMEIYSIDEAFLRLDQFQHRDLVTFMQEVQAHIKQCTGLPVSIGIATTKTLAKIANAIAKKSPHQAVFDLRDPVIQADRMKHFPVEKIWGIGRNLAARLKNLHIDNAFQLCHADPKMLRLHFSVVMEKLVSELRGIPCIPLESVQPRKQIISSRSFGKAVTSLFELEEAISHYTITACTKLRRQHSVASGIVVFLQTNLFNENASRHADYQTFHFPIPISDTRYIIRIAKKCLATIYKEGHKYHKAGLMLLNVMPETFTQEDMFLQGSAKSTALMKTVDAINQLYGRNKISYCAEGIRKPWLIRCDLRSPRYTTRMNELVRAHCR